MGQDGVGHGGQEHGGQGHGVRDGQDHGVHDGVHDEALENMVRGLVNMELGVQEQGEHKAQVGQLLGSPHEQGGVLLGQEL